MIRKNIYSRITESIVNAYHDNNLDTAMDDGHEMENMGKKIVASISADPAEDLDWESEYEPFGREELTADDEAECCEHEGIEHDTCPSCGSDVDGHIVSDDEDDDTEENDDMEDIMIGGGFETEDEGDEYEDMDVKDILVDILHELKGEDSEEGEDEGAFETSDENPMFGGEVESDEDEDDDEDDFNLEPQDDWSSEESDDDDETEEDYDDAEDEQSLADENGVETEEDYKKMLNPAEQEEDEVYTWDALDNA